MNQSYLLLLLVLLFRLLYGRGMVKIAAIFHLLLSPSFSAQFGSSRTGNRTQEADPMNGAPLKPWQTPVKETDGSLMSTIQPDPPITTIDLSADKTLHSPPYPGQYPPYATNNPTPYGYGGMYGMGAPYGGGFFGNPFTGTGNILPNEPLLPPDSPFSATEQRIRNLINTVGSLMRVVGGVFQMIDSTAYAAWSSVMAIVSVMEQLKLLRQEHLKSWIDVIKKAIQWGLMVLRIRRNGNSPSIPLSNHPASMIRNSPVPTSPNRRFLSDVVVPAVAVGLSYMALKSLVQMLQKPAAPKGRLAKAQFPFSAAGGEYLDFEEGDDLYVLGDEFEEGWVHARDKSGKTGTIPINYVKFVESHQ